MIRLRNAFSRLFRRRKRKLRVLFSYEVKVEGRKKPLKIEVVVEQPCPYCGAIFPNRPKVHDGEGWWWRCYTEDCAVQYYLPERRVATLRTGERVSYGELIRRYKRGIFKVRTWTSLLMK
jgi:hypothetical protein